MKSAWPPARALSCFGSGAAHQPSFLREPRVTLGKLAFSPFDRAADQIDCIFLERVPPPWNVSHQRVSADVCLWPSSTSLGAGDTAARPSTTSTEVWGLPVPPWGLTAAGATRFQFLLYLFFWPPAWSALPLAKRSAFALCVWTVPIWALPGAVQLTEDRTAEGCCSHCSAPPPPSSCPSRAAALGAVAVGAVPRAGIAV